MTEVKSSHLTKRCQQNEVNKKMKTTNLAIKTVKERLNNTAKNFFYGTNMQTWETTLLSSKFYICFRL